MKNFRIYITIFLIFKLSSTSIIAQQLSTNISTITFQEFKSESSLNKRKIIDFSKKSFVQKINPLLYVGAGLLFVYQRVFSEQIQATCVYKKSCSEFTKLSIEKKGIIKGTLTGFNQLSNCFQSVIFDRSSYLVTEDGKINNALDECNQD
jgi:putative component of membrane protein insertase Oxa1/YidC/SpoIIIJ protein YidD